jgi:hypothetical protein
VAGGVLVCQNPQQIQDFMTIETILTFDVFTNFLSSHDVSYSTCFFISLYRKYGRRFFFSTRFLVFVVMVIGVDPMMNAKSRIFRRYAFWMRSSKNVFV